MRLDFQQCDRSGRFYRVYQHASSQPGWIWQTTLTVGVLVFLGPLVLLAVTAMLVMGAVYLTLSLAHGIAGLFSRPVPLPDDSAGRINVRVIPHDEP